MPTSSGWRAAVRHGRARPWLFALLPCYALSDRRAVIDGDIEQWCRRQYRQSRGSLVELVALGPQREFRSVLYYRLRGGNRLGRVSALVVSRLLRPLDTLDIATDDIGAGFVVTHGYGTIINAERIGRNFWVHHGVTIGFDYGRGNPIIGDDVFVGVGAVVLGRVRIGDGAKIGANAVVVKDVEAGATIVGVPGRPVPPRTEGPGLGRIDDPPDRGALAGA